MRRPAAALVVAAGLFVADPVVAADWGTGSTNYYPGAFAPVGDTYGRQQGGAAGSYRPAEGSGGSWRAPGSGGSASTWLPSSPWEQGGAAARDSLSQGHRGPSATGQADRPLGDYRFRQRPEDKSQKTDEGLKYRPDPELARRSQQFWGVPGQDPSTYGGGPGVVFRPLRPEQEQTGKSTGGQHGGDVYRPSQGGYPGGMGYGYPY